MVPAARRESVVKASTAVSGPKNMELWTKLCRDSREVAHTAISPLSGEVPSMRNASVHRLTVLALSLARAEDLSMLKVVVRRWPTESVPKGSVRASAAGKKALLGICNANTTTPVIIYVGKT